MGKHGRTSKFGAACLAGVALTAPWTVMSSPADRARSDGAANAPQAVRLDFDEAVPETIFIPVPKDLVPPTVKPVEAAKVPAVVPGASAAPFPKLDPINQKVNEELLSKLYPPLPPVGSITPPELGPEGRPISLDDLQRYAEASNASIRQAAIDIGAPCGPGHFESVFQDRQKHAKAIAAVESQLADAARTRVRAEVFAAVRHDYFAVLASQERMRVQEAFTRFADDAYRVQVDRAKTGQAPPAEALQFRAIAYQARVELVQARNSYLSSWKQLAAAVGRLDLRPSLLEGRIDRPLPLLDFEALHVAVLTHNSEIAAAQCAIDKSQIVLGSYPVAPYASVHRAEAHARADLGHVEDEPSRARGRLTAQLAQAFERYDNQRRTLVYYRDNILSDQVTAYRALASLPRQGPEIPSTDLVLAQQNLATSLKTYLHALEEAWFAIAEIGRLVQARDVFNVGSEATVTQLTFMNALPSCQNSAATMNWPEVMLTGPVTAATGSGLIPDLRPAQTSIRLSNDSLLEMPVAPVRATPQPVSGTALLAPLASVERSTKRRKIFSWPAWRVDGSAPLTLPQTDDASPCAPTADSPAPVAPKSVPQSKQHPGPAAAKKLPDVPAAPVDPMTLRLQRATLPARLLPQTVEAPVEPNSRGLTTAAESTSHLILINAIEPAAAPAPQGIAPVLIDLYIPADVSYLPEPVPPLRLSSPRKK